LVLYDIVPNIIYVYFAKTVIRTEEDCLNGHYTMPQKMNFLSYGLMAQQLVVRTRRKREGPDRKGVMTKNLH